MRGSIFGIFLVLATALAAVVVVIWAITHSHQVFLAGAAFGFAAVALAVAGALVYFRMLRRSKKPGES